MSEIHESVWIAPGVQIYGEVNVAEDCSIWPNAVLRAECQQITVGRMTNIQDHAMVHVGYDSPTRIGEFCSVTHHATVHGATLGDHCLVGVNAVLMDGVVIGEGSIVAGGAMVKEGSVFGPGSIIAGVPAKLVREQDSAKANRMNAWLYYRNAQAYMKGDHRTWVGEEFERWKTAKAAEVYSDKDILKTR